MPLIVDIRLLKLPIPLLVVVIGAWLVRSSVFVIRMVFGRGRNGFGGTTVPAENWISSKKLSLSVANLRRASSKASSLSEGVVSICTPLSVLALFRLLPVVLVSIGPIMLPMLFRASQLYLDLLFRFSTFGEPGVSGLGLETGSVSRAVSSSMVASTGGGEAGWTALSS